MKKIVKKLVITVVVLGVIAVGGLYALSKFAPLDYIQEKARVVVKEQTGRDLSIGGTKVVFWPHIGVTLQDVALSNAEGAIDKSMITLGELDVHVALRPLFDKRVEVVRFVLNQPEINLEVSPKGQANWEFPQAAKKTTPAADKKDGSGAQNDALAAFSLNEFEIRKGRVIYNDRQKQTKAQVDDVNMTVSFPDINSAFQLDGSLTYLGKRVQVVMGIESPKDFIDGKPSSGNLVLGTDLVKANIEGKFATKGRLVRADKMTADVPSLAALVAWLAEKPAEKMPFERVLFTARADIDGQSVNLADASLRLDDIESRGTASVRLSGARPFVHARLTLNKINLDRFLEGSSGKDSAAASKATVPDGDWDATPIDFSGLRAVDADVHLATDGFSVNGVEVGKSDLRVLLKDGKLEFSSSEASLFGGLFSSNVTLVSAASGASEQKLKFTMKNVQAQPVLEKFADFKKLTGAADATINVSSRGVSQKEIVSNLAGDGNVTFKNGAITGIDFVNIAQMIQRGLQDAGVGEGKTEFVDLGGTFKIASGIVTNNDFRMRGPLVQAGGAGTVDLPRKYLKYRVTPVLTASSGVDNAKGVSIPVDIVGPFSNVRIKPDFKSIISNAVSDPEGLKEQGKALEQNLKGIKNDLKKDPGAAIQNLLGGGGAGLFGTQKAPAEAAPAAAAPVETAPAQSPAVAPVETPAAPVETAPVETAPVEAAPVETAPAEAAPAEPAP